MFKKKLPVFYILLSSILGSVLTILIIKTINKSISDQDGSSATIINNTSVCSYNMLHLNGYKYIQPLISADPECEDDKYAAFKADILSYTDGEKPNGLANVSVYVRDLTRGEWFAINPDEKYDPGSLLKVGVLITYLRMAETNSKLLNTEVVYHSDKGFVFPTEHFTSDTVVEGHKYKVSDLLHAMIVNSDNRATWFLEKSMSPVIFKKLFTDLGMKEPQFTDQHYLLAVKEYSNLMKALYYAGYLNINASEYATSLLAESKFKNGLLKELPPSVKVAHKFGESGDPAMHQLHESGIVYLNNNPYLITIMTRGTDWDKLSQVMGHISKMVYDKMAANPS